MKIIHKLLLLTLSSASFLSAQIIPNGSGLGGMAPDGKTFVRFVAETDMPEKVKPIVETIVRPLTKQITQLEGKIADLTIEVAKKATQQVNARTVENAQGFSGALLNASKNTGNDLISLLTNYPAHTCCLFTSCYSLYDWYCYINSKNKNASMPWQSTIVALMFGFCAYKK